MKHVVPALCLFLTLTAPLKAQTTANIPAAMNFQGRLAKPDGTPVADGSHTLTFTLYAAVSGGTALWTQAAASVPVHSGTFATLLNFGAGYTGTNTADSVFASSPYLEIAVDGAALAPRQTFQSQAYSFRSVQSNLALTVPDGSITAGKLAAGTITAASLSTSLQQTLGLLSYAPLKLAGSVGTGNSPDFIAAAGKYAYVVNLGSNTLQVFDVSNPVSPALKGSVSTGSGSSGPLAVAVSGNYAYVIGQASNLQIFDVSNPSSPTFKGSIGTAAFPESIAVSGNYAYVVNDNNSLLVFDVSNPVSPALKVTVPTALQPVFITISGNNAYVACNYNFLQVFDISYPLSTITRGGITIPGNPLCVATSGSNAYVGNSANTLYVVDISNPASLTIKSSIGTGDYPSSIAASGNFAYVANRLSNASGGYDLQVFDMSNAAAPALLSTTAASSVPISIAVSGGYAYVVNEGDNTLQVFTGNALAANSNLQVTGSGFFAGVLTASGGIKFADGTTQNSAGLASGSAAGGDLNGTYPNPTIAANAVVTAKIADGAITGTKIASGVIPTALPPNGAAGGDLVGSFYPNPVIAANAVTTAKIAAGAVTAAKIASGVIPTALPPNGAAGGDLTGTYPSPTIATGAVTGAKIASSTLTNTNLASDAASLNKVTGSAMSVSGSNVGIGNAAPAFPLSFPSTIGDKISLWGTSGNNFGLGIGNSLMQLYTNNATSDIAFGYGTSAAFTETMRVRGTGNVGIGTSTPAAKLDVAGTVRMTGFTLSTVASAGKVLVSDAGGTGTWQAVSLSGITAGGDLTGTYPNPTIAANVIDNTRLASDAAALVKVSGGAMTSSNGNIGIGTATPAGIFDVYGTYTNGSQAVDQQQTLNDGPAGELYGKDFWQSFTAGSTGYLTRLDLYISSPTASTAAGTLSIYAGEGVGGTLLSSQTITYQAVYNTFQTYTLTSPPLLTTGQKYTYRITTPTVGAYWVYRRNGDPYPAGICSVAGLDLIFKTYVTPTAATSILTVSNGAIGIRKTNPAYPLDVTGDINASGSVRASGVALTSDARYKTHVAALDNALEDVLALRGVTYDWDREKWAQKGFPEGKQIGFIAQELEKVLPELVNTDKDGYKSVLYQNLVPVLVEAIKAQQKQLDDKQRQIDELKRQNGEIETLKRQVTELLAIAKKSGN